MEKETKNKKIRKNINVTILWWHKQERAQEQIKKTELESLDIDRHHCRFT